VSNSVHLKKFSSDELILDESETRTVLKFFWPQESVATRIDESLIVTDSVREFAQALLVEAVDASYQVGFIEAIVRSTANPTRGAVKVLKDFGKRAAKTGSNTLGPATFRKSASTISSGITSPVRSG